MDKNRVKSTAKKLGFHAKGDFLIGKRNKDVVSGLAVDGAPSSIYVWTFVLPAFDDLAFMHMSLGERVIDLALSEYPLEVALSNTWKAISAIEDANQIITYLDAGKIGGEYADWTRFLCLVRSDRFDQADRMLGVVEKLQSAGIPRKVKELQDARSYGGWPAVQDLLIEWSIRTEKLLVGVPSSE